MNRQPNVLLVVLDSVRAKNTSLHGHDTETTPFLEAFGDVATVYEQARAPSFFSLPSHASLFTGVHTKEHGVCSITDRLEEGHTIWEELASTGYDTGLFSRNGYLTKPDFGLNRGFQRVCDLSPPDVPFPAAGTIDEFRSSREHALGSPRKYASFVDFTLKSGKPLGTVLNVVSAKTEFLETETPTEYHDQCPAKTYADAFLSWQRERSGPWAACINFMDAHGPYEPVPQYNEWGDDALFDMQSAMDGHWEFYQGEREWWQKKALEALYDGTILQVDSVLEYLVETLKERDVYDETLIVVTGDHGEGFGERSRVYPTFRLSSHWGGAHEILFHVPLIVKYPQQSEGETVSSVASSTEFPAAVRAVIADRWDREEFVPAGPVVSYADLTRRWENDNTLSGEEGDAFFEQYAGEVVALYRNDGNVVRKEVTWDDESAVIEARDAQHSWRVEDDTELWIEFEFEDRDMKQSADIDSLEPDTYNRLEDLGYI